MGNNRSPHKDGTFRRLPRHHGPRRPSRPLTPTSYKTPRTAKQYCIRQRVPVYLRLLETCNGSTQDITQPQHSLPPTNGRTNGKSQFHPRFLPALGTRIEETPQVSEYVTALRRLHEELRADIKEVQMSQAEQANKARHPDPVLNPGDRVWLRRKHIRTTRPSNKLDHK